MGKLSLLSICKTHTELLELTMYEVQGQSYIVLHMERVSVSLIWSSLFILEGTKARDSRCFPKIKTTLVAALFKIHE